MNIFEIIAKYLIIWFNFEDSCSYINYHYIPLVFRSMIEIFIVFLFKLFLSFVLFRVLLRHLKLSSSPW